MTARQLLIGMVFLSMGAGAYAADTKLSALPAKTADVALTDSIVIVDASDGSLTRQLAVQDLYTPVGYQLQRSDNGNYETAVKDREYISPHQHGGIFGMVYRRYVELGGNGSNGATSSQNLGVTVNRIVDFGGYYKEYSGGYLCVIPNAKEANLQNTGAMLYISGATLTLDGNAGERWSAAKLWIDYTR